MALWISRSAFRSYGVVTNIKIATAGLATKGEVAIPKKPKNAFLLFQSQTMPILQEEDKNKEKSEQRNKQKLCSQMWHDLDDSSRAKYEDTYKEAMAQYQLEMNGLSDEQKDELAIQAEMKKEERKQLEKIFKLLGKPKRAKTANNIFLEEEAKGKPIDVLPELQARWSSLSDAEKKPYVEEAKKAREIYELEYSLWQDYCTDADIVGKLKEAFTKKKKSKA